MDPNWFSGPKACIKEEKKNRENIKEKNIVDNIRIPNLLKIKTVPNSKKKPEPAVVRAPETILTPKSLRAIFILLCLSG